MSPTQIEQISPTELLIKWDDGHESPFTLEYLRQHRPCAMCKGEIILWKTYKPVTLPVITLGMYCLEDIQQVGSYAIQITWGDRHNTGIYAYEYLREICPCEECKRN